MPTESSILDKVGTKSEQFPKRGITLVEVLVGTFLILIVFLGIFGGYQLSLKVVGQSKNKTIATEIANGELEKIRNLSYESIGTAGGFPGGVLEDSKNVTRNNINFTIETRVDYVVDSADGISTPEDDCPNDYKKVEVKVSWSGTLQGEVILVTDVSPKSLAEECSETGGILLVSVFDAYGIMVPSPLIEIKNPETGVLIKDATPVEGKHFFSLAPATYKVVVSKSGYSTERSYGIDEIVTPEKPHPLVLEGQLTENSFSIDKLSSFSVETLSPWGMDYFSDSFLDQSKVSEFSNVTIGGGEVVLENTSPLIDGVASGFLVSTDIIPANLISWEEFSFNDSEPAGTLIVYQVLYFDGTNWVLVPNIDLLGNSIGFMVSPIDLSGLDITTYQQLKLKANFSTFNVGVSPVLFDWQVFWKSSEATPIANATFHLQGAKIIGKDAEEQPVYKYYQDHTSGGDGHIEISNLEWDSYTFSVDPVTDLDLVSTNPAPQPIGLAPDTPFSVTLYLDSQNSLLTSVQNIETGAPIFSAAVRLYKTDLTYDLTQYTDEKGESYFIPLDNGVYNIKVQGPGYLDYFGLVSVSGDVIKIINLQQVE